MYHILLSLLVFFLFVGCGSSASLSSNGTLTVSGSDDTVKSVSASNTTPELHYVKTVSIHGIAQDIVLSDDGNYAYIASGNYLEVIDISNPQKAKLIGTYDTQGYVNRVAVIGTIVNVYYDPQTWDNYVSVEAYDMYDATDPEYLGYYEVQENNDHLYAQSDYFAYLIQDKYFYAINLNDNTLYDRYSLYEPYAFGVYGDYIFIANGHDGVTILQNR